LPRSTAELEGGKDAKVHSANDQEAPNNDQEAPSNDQAEIASSPAQCQSKMECQHRITELEATNADKDRKMEEMRITHAAKIAELQLHPTLKESSIGGSVEDILAAADQQHCVDAPNCNPAKCHGSAQDNRVMYGNLDCEGAPQHGWDTNQGSKCLDNLSAGKFYVSGTDGKGRCQDFDTAAAFSRKTTYDNTGGARDRTISKFFSGHPHKTPKTIGVISGKRIKCEGDTCYVFKVGYCIKCPRDVFRKDKERDATQEDISKFYNCCVMGNQKYTRDNGSQQHCDSAFRTGVYAGGAFTATNNPTAELKPQYKCDDEDDVAAAEAMMKIS